MSSTGQAPHTFQRQNRWSPKRARTNAEALRSAAILENDLEALLQGKPVKKSVGIEGASVSQYLIFQAIASARPILCNPSRNISVSTPMPTRKWLGRPKKCPGTAEVSYSVRSRVRK